MSDTPEYRRGHAPGEQGFTPRLLNTREVARMIGVRPNTVRRLASRGIIPCVRLTRKIIRYDPGDIAQFLATHKLRGRGGT